MCPTSSFCNLYPLNKEVSKRFEHLNSHFVDLDMPFLENQKDLDPCQLTDFG